MPLITTLIPAYKKTYLAQTLRALTLQSMRDFKVIISDDSPNAEITALFGSGHFAPYVRELDITLVRGPGHARLNQLHLLDVWAGSTPLLHIQLDDDVIYPAFYLNHVKAHQQTDACFSASARWIGDDSATPLLVDNTPAWINDSPLRMVTVAAEPFFASMLPNCHNWVGEFSNIVIRKEAIADWPRPSATEFSYLGWPDVGFMLSAVRHKPMVWIRDHLSLFRRHSEQTTHIVHQHGARVSNMAWAANALLAWSEGRIDDRTAAGVVIQTVQRCLQRYGEEDQVINQFFDIVQKRGASLSSLYSAFVPFWIAFLASDRATAAPSVDLPAAPRGVLA